MCPHCQWLNLLDISWSSLTGTSPFSDSLCELIFDLNLMQHVNSPTHLKGNILDFVLTNVDTTQDLMVSPPPHSLASDHYTITFSMKFGKQKNLKTSYECPKWFTPDIRHLSICCCTLRRKCKPHPTPHNCSKLKLSVEKLQAKWDQQNQITRQT